MPQSYESRETALTNSNNRNSRLEMVFGFFMDWGIFEVQTHCSQAGVSINCKITRDPITFGGKG